MKGVSSHCIASINSGWIIGSISSSHPASSTSGSPTPIFLSWPWTSRRCQQQKWYISKTAPSSSRRRRLLESAACAIRTWPPHGIIWLHSDWGLENDDAAPRGGRGCSDDKRGFIQYQVCPLSERKTPAASDLWEGGAYRPGRGDPQR